MRIAICEPNKADYCILLDYVNKFNILYDLYYYSSGTELIDASHTQDFDIVLLEIKLPDLNGMSAARIIKEKNKNVLIIFITPTPSYAVQGYGVAFRYLLKPLERSQFNDAFQDALNKITSKKIIITNKGNHYIISIDSIYYFEVSDHNLFIHTINETLVCRLSLRSILVQLEGQSFASPHKSYSVNLQYITSIEQDYVVLTNGDRIKLSRSCKKNFKHSLDLLLK